MDNFQFFKGGMKMQKEARYSKDTGERWDIMVKIPLRLRCAMWLLGMSSYAVLLVLVALVAEAPRLIMSTVYGLSRDVILQNTPLLTGIAMFSLVFFGLLGVFVFFIICEMNDAPYMLGFGAVIMLMLICGARGRTMPTNELYIGILQAGSFVAGYSLRWWANFARYKADELYIKEVQKQTADVFENEIWPNIQRDSATIKK